MPDLAVIFGGPTPEHDVSILTGLQAVRELETPRDRAIHAIYWSKAGDWYEVDTKLEANAFIDGVPANSQLLRFELSGSERGFIPVGGRFSKARKVEFEAAIICCHGGPGEDGTLQASLDLAGISYSGPNHIGAALGMDKLAFSAIVASTGLPTLPRIALNGETSSLEYGGPFIVKPRFGGSSIGIEVVEDLNTALALQRTSIHLRSGAVIEPYRPDLFDLQIGVRSWPELSLSAVERPLRTQRTRDRAIEPEILGYVDKYVGGEGMASAPRQLPAEIEPALESALREMAREVSKLVSVRGVARIDFLSDGTELFINEINTIPGSLARYLWIDPVVPFSKLLGDLESEALQSATHRYGSSGADGLVLRGAASIAAKLA